MKKLFTTLVIALASYCSYAQNTFPASGNVGIGTTTPTAGLLQINGINDMLSLYNVSNSNIQFNAYNNADFRIIQRSNAVMTFWTNTIERMRIDQNGNMGIGTTNPTSKLTVAPVSNNSSIDQTIAVIQGGGSTGFGGFVGQRVISGNNRQGLIVSGTSSLTLQAQTYNIDFITGAVTPADDTNLRMRILANGNVGIGTVSPDTKLAVAGTIHSQAVTVDMVGWPDFVFKPTYQLPALTDVKTYIDKNHHLPDVPSATEVEKNGLNLGEMNKVLVQKLEELTLYLIEQNKQLIKQNTMLADQQKTNQSQQAQIDEMKKSLDNLNHKKSK